MFPGMLDTPVNFEPIWVASLILCASPPDKVPAERLKVKYSNPTFFKKFNLASISFINKSEISFCDSVSFKFSKRPR